MTMENYIIKIGFYRKEQKEIVCCVGNMEQCIHDLLLKFNQNQNKIKIKKEEIYMSNRKKPHMH